MSTTAVSLTTRLDAEWEHLASSAPAIAALARWGRLEPELAGWTDLEQLRAAVHDRGDVQRSDQILAALVRLAAVDGRGDVLAARVVLQLLVPGARRLARSLATLTGDVAAAEAAVFAELTILIRTYPWRRRPCRTAANLLLDCRQHLTRSLKRTRLELAAGLSPERNDVADPVEGEGRLALNDLLWWAQRRGVLDRFEAELLVASHVAGIPMSQLVTRFGRSRSTLFMLRASAEHRLRDALTAHRPEARPLPARPARGRTGPARGRPAVTAARPAA